MNDENQNGEFGEFGNPLIDWAIRKLGTPQVGLFFISRAIAEDERRGIICNVPNYEKETGVWEFCTFQMEVRGMQEFRDAVLKMICDWLESEGFFGGPPPKHPLEGAPELVFTLKVGCPRPQKTCVVVIGFSYNLAMIAIRKPFLYFDDSEPEVGEEWKNEE